jgi:nuclease HARBI1
MAYYMGAVAALDEEEGEKKYRRVTDITDFDLRTWTRLDRATFYYVLGLLVDDLSRQNERNYAVPADTQLLVGLSCLASGSFQWTMGGLYGVSQTTTSDIIRRVVVALNRIAVDHIKFPSTVAELNATKQDFYRRGGIRNVVGIIDCTHVQFQPLKAEEAQYVDRKGLHTINVQLVCNERLEITDVVARWPGSVHDSFIWSNCGLRESMIEIDGWLLGDSGYPLEPWLLTKYRNPVTDPQRQFNTAIGRVRSLIENVNGILKSRWRVLAKSGGEMLYRADKVCDITVACCVLHNICVRRNVVVEDLEMIPAADLNYPRDVAADAAHVNARAALRARAVAIRDRLVEDDFTQ